MADTNISMGMYGDKLRLFGLSGTFDTQALLNATIQSMELKNLPYKNQLVKYEEEKTAWSNLKLQLEAFNKTVGSLKDITTENRKVTVADVGMLSVEANSSAMQSNYKVEVTTLASSHKMKTNAQVNATEVLGHAGEIQINGKAITIESDMSLSDIAVKINGTKDTNVNAVIVGGSMVLTSTKTGADNAISFTDSAADASGILKNLGLLNIDGTLNQVNQVQEAKNAAFIIDGIALTNDSNTVSDAVGGVTLTLHKEGTTTVKVDQNDALIKERTKKFVDDYNTIIRYLNSVTGKEAILQGKTAPMRAKNDMVTGIMEKTNSALRMFDVGISIDGLAKNGSIAFDEAKLTKQLEENPQEVLKLLTGDGSVSSFIYKRLNEATNATGSLTSTLDGIGKRIANIEETIRKNEERFEIEQQTLLKKFAQYEVTMSGLETQMKYMEAQIKAMNANKD